MAAPTGADLAAILASSVRVTRRMEILDADGATWAEPDIIEGEVSLDASRSERRTIDVLLAGDDGELLRVGSDYVWFDKVLKVYRGIEYSGGSWEALLGTFLIDAADTVHFPDTIHITGRDFSKKLLIDKFLATTTFRKGRLLSDVITAIATNSGITDLQLPWGTIASVVPGGSTTNPSPELETDATFDAGSDRWSALHELCTAHGYEVYFDANARLVVRSFQDPATRTPTFTFQVGAAGTLASWQKAIGDANLFNHVVVIGESQGAAPVWAEAKITNRAHPAHEDWIGDRVAEPYRSGRITSTTQAQTVANRLLRFAALEDYALTLESVVIPWLEPGDVVGFDDPDPANDDDPTSFFLHDFTIPLTLGPMTSNAKRIVLVS